MKNPPPSLFAFFGVCALLSLLGIAITSNDGGSLKSIEPRDPVVVQPETAAAQGDGRSFGTDRRRDINTLVYAFELSWSQSMTLQSEAGPSTQSTERHIDGLMQWSTIGDGTAGVRALRCAELSARGLLDGRWIDDGDTAQLLEAHPVLVQHDARGNTLGYRFAEALSSEERDIVRTLVSAARFVKPQDAQETSWSAGEADPTGSYRAHYDRRSHGSQQGGFSVHKTKVFPDGTDSPAVIDSFEAVATYGGGGDENYLEAQYAERIVADVKDVAAIIRVTIEAQFRHMQDSEAFADSVALPATMLAGSQWASLDGADEDVDDDASLDDEDPITVGEASASLAALLARDDLDPLARLELLDRLAAEVARNPDILPELQRWLDEAQDARIASFVLTSIGAADSPQASDFFAQRLADPLRAPDDRARSAIASSQLSHPTPEVYRALRDLSGSSQAPRTLRQTSLLALAALASTAEPSEDSAAAAQAVLDQEALARSNNELPAWFDALANLGSEAALDKLEHYTANPDPKLRHAACRATGRIHSPRALDLLFSRRADPSPTVRAAITFALGLRFADCGPAVAPVLTDDPDESVRAAAISGLARCDDSTPRTRNLLQRFATSDPSPTLRALATRSLTTD